MLIATMFFWNIWTDLACANSADPDQTDLKEQFDLGLHCLSFNQQFQAHH